MNALDHTASRHTSLKVRSASPLPVRLVFDHVGGGLNVVVKNATRRYSSGELDTFGKRIQALQEKGTIPEHGSITLQQLGERP